MQKRCHALPGRAPLGALSAFVGLAASSSQGLQLNRVMRQKLDRAQRILEGVVTSDWVSLETNTRELEQVTNDPRWMVLKSPEYAQQSAAFVLAVSPYGVRYSSETRM